MLYGTEDKTNELAAFSGITVLTFYGGYCLLLRVMAHNNNQRRIRFTTQSVKIMAKSITLKLMLMSLPINFIKLSLCLVISAIAQTNATIIASVNGRHKILYENDPGIFP
jgi:hypothetical protein